MHAARTEASFLFDQIAHAERNKHMSQPAKANATNPKLAENLAKADKYLARFRGKRLPHFIAGKHEAGHSGRSFDNLTPVDNSTLCEVARGDAADIDAAAQAAKRAFPAWRDLPGDERKRSPARGRRSDRSARGGDRDRREHGYRPADPIHGESCAARRGELSLLRRSRARRAATDCRCRRRSI